MKTDAPSFSWRRAASFAAVALGMFTLAALALHPRWLRPGHFIEAAAYGLLASLFASHPPVREAIQGLDTKGKRLLFALSLVLLFAQMFGGGRHIFPLVRFAMFTDASDRPAPGLFFHATFSDGKQRLLQPAEMLPPGSEGRFEGMAKTLAERNRATHVPLEEWPETLLGRSVRGLMASYNTLNPEAPIVRLDVSSCCTDIDMEAPRPQARRTELFSVMALEGANGPR